MTSKSYLQLQKRLEQSPQGAPASEALFKILEILFSPKEAELVSVLPVKMFTAKKAGKIWRKPEREARVILDGLADKGLLLDMANNGEQVFVLAPTMAGFFEFSLMRTDGKFDRKILSELYHQYINIEDRFLKEVLALDPGIARTFVQESALEPKEEKIIMDYERASQVIKTATCITVGTCYCRHKMEHMGKACQNPQDVCLTFNNAAKSLSKHGIAKEISQEEAFKVLDRCVELGLVQVGDNVQKGVSWICNCCSCCCEALLAYKRLGCDPKINSNYYAKINDNCINCGTCAKRCPVGAIKLKKAPEVDRNVCIGCGVCARFCPKKCISMERRDKTKYVPKDTFERFVVSAILQGKLQNLIFDNFSLWTNDLLKRLVGTILKLEPVKRKLADAQLGSRYLDSLAKVYFLFDKTINDGKKPDYSHPELKGARKN